MVVERLKHTRFSISWGASPSSYRAWWRERGWRAPLPPSHALPVSTCTSWAPCSPRPQLLSPAEASKRSALAFQWRHENSLERERVSDGPTDLFGPPLDFIHKLLRQRALFQSHERFSVLSHHLFLSPRYLIVVFHARGSEARRPVYPRPTLCPNKLQRLVLFHLVWRENFDKRNSLTWVSWSILLTSISGFGLYLRGSTALSSPSFPPTLLERELLETLVSFCIW